MSLIKTESGGMFNSYKIKYSPETHEFLKVLMEEAKLTTAQRTQMKECLNKGEPLPALWKKPHRLSRVDENLFGLKRNHYFQKRSQNQIIRSGVYEKEKYRFLEEKVNSQKEKEKLQNIMVYGNNPKFWESQKMDIERVKKSCTTKTLTKEERFEELKIEVEERLEFLREMKSMGKAKNYEVITNQEVAGKLWEMKKLDKNAAAKYLKEIQPLMKIFCKKEKNN